jgi:hypothetical protein
MGITDPVVSTQSDAVTVVPFTVDDPDNGAILLPAELGGHRGIVLLDTGTPIGGLLNRQYVKPNAAGGLDTVLAGEPIPQNQVTLHVPVRIGTLQTPNPVNVLVADDSGFARNHRFQSSIGRIGLAALKPFDAIIDYAHQRLILIRLDSAGHRLAAVPAYTPTRTIPLIHPVSQPHWGVEGRIGGVLDTLVLDTGTPMGMVITSRTAPTVRTHIVNGYLDHLVVAGRTFDSVDVADFGQIPLSFDIIGYKVLRRYGAVGINQRTRQLELFH